MLVPWADSIGPRYLNRSVLHRLLPLITVALVSLSSVVKNSILFRFIHSTCYKDKLIEISFAVER